MLWDHLPRHELDWPGCLSTHAQSPPHRPPFPALKGKALGKKTSPSQFYSRKLGTSLPRVQPAPQLPAHGWQRLSELKHCPRPTFYSSRDRGILHVFSRKNNSFLQKLFFPKELFPTATSYSVAYSTHTLEARESSKRDFAECPKSPAQDVRWKVEIWAGGEVRGITCKHTLSVFLLPLLQAARRMPRTHVYIG